MKKNNGIHYAKSKTKQIVFPLGGIGTGSIGLCGNGRLQDWEIFNAPNKGSFNGRSHIAVKAECKGKTVVKVLNGDMETDYMGMYQHSEFTGYGFGPVVGTMAGFSHFREHTFTARFPFAEIAFSDEDFPCTVTLEAYNPFIPNDSKNSSLPVAFFTVTFENQTDCDMDVTGALSVANPYPKTKNKMVRIAGTSAVQLSHCGEKNTPNEGNLTIASFGEQQGAQEYWYRGDWMDGIATFWRQFSEGELPQRHYETPAKRDTATVWAKAHVPAKGRAQVHFLLGWYHPICENTWDKEAKDENGNPLRWKNYYASLFRSSAEVVRYCKKNARYLYTHSRRFADAMMRATLPEVVKDAVTANLSVLKSPTVLRTEDGSFWAWEGVHEKKGSCPGTCTHVWNYTYAMCFLFPDLERNIRETDYRYNLRDTGLMRFRLPIPFTKEHGWEMACVDGQMGGIIKTYREWKLSGNTDWLKNLWQSVKKSLDFATSPENPFRWDADGDGVLEGRQHHTLDMELFGPSAWLEGFYLTALKAGVEMAKAMGDDEAEKRWTKLFENGSAFTEKELFNGNYYIQKVDLTDRKRLESFGEEVVKKYWNEEAGQMKYQIADGSEIDQLCGQWHADICGLGDIFDKNHRKIALQYLFVHNFKPSVRTLNNTWRNYAVNDEAGAVICDYTDAEKPLLPIPYTEECMHGFEYQLAGLLIGEGFVDEGLTVVRGVRDRYDGEKRNPFNEMECGSNYARSMASYALLPIFSGFTFDYTKHHIGFSPVGNPKTFRAPFSVGDTFAELSIRHDKATLTLLEGTLSLQSIALPNLQNLFTVTADGEEIPYKIEQNTLIFPQIVTFHRRLQLKYKKTLTK